MPSHLIILPRHPSKEKQTGLNKRHPSQNGPLRKHIRQCLVSTNQILLDSNMILDLEEDDGRGAEERSGQQYPIGDELLSVGQVARIQGPHHGCAGGLNALVETNVVG